MAIKDIKDTKDTKDTSYTSKRLRPSKARKLITANAVELH